MLYKKWNDYLVYEDGKIFDILKNKFVKTYITNSKDLIGIISDNLYEGAGNE